MAPRRQGSPWLPEPVRAPLARLLEIRRREQPARARRLLLLRDALLLGVGPGRHARRGSAGIGDRPAEIAGQRRAELGNAARKPGVVARQIGEAVGRRTVAGVVELGAGRRPMRREREESAAATPAAATTPRPSKTLRESRVTGGRFCRSRIGLERRRARFRGFGHDCGLPSVRTMRTFFCSRRRAELGRGEQPIDDHVVAPDAIVDELGVAFRADDPERRHLALADAGSGTR